MNEREEIWGQLHIVADPIGEPDSDGHQEHAVVISIENHGIPQEKFVDSILAGVITMVTESVKGNVEVPDEISDEQRDQVINTIVRGMVSMRLRSTEFPVAGVAFSMPDAMG